MQANQNIKSPFGPPKMPTLPTSIIAPGTNRGPILQMPMKHESPNGSDSGVAGPSGNWLQQIMQMFSQGNQTANQPAKNIFESMRF